MFLRLIIQLHHSIFCQRLTGAWSTGWSVRLVVGGPGFDYLNESDKKDLEGWCSLLPHLTFSIKG